MVSFLLQSDHKLYAINHWVHSLQSLLGFCLSLGSRRRGVVFTLEFIIHILRLFMWNCCYSGHSFLEKWGISRGTQLPQRNIHGSQQLSDCDRVIHRPPSCSGAVMQAASKQAGSWAGAGSWWFKVVSVPFHAAVCPQRNSHKWGPDELSREAVSSAVLNHREVYGGVSKWLPANQSRQPERPLPLLPPFTPLPSSYEIERWFPGPRVWATYMRAIRAFISSFLLPFKASYPSLSPLCIAHPNKSHCG